jgi:hypothetical protein
MIIPHANGLLKLHHKNVFQYGYRIPESDEGMLYYQVYFKPIGNKLFTYPLHYRYRCQRKSGEYLHSFNFINTNYCYSSKFKEWSYKNKLILISNDNR